MNNTKPIVYVVDDDHGICRSLSLLIEGVGLDVQTYATAEDFLDAYDPDRHACLVVDVRMPGMSGLELQSRLASQHINLPVIVVTGHGDIPMAVDAMKAGIVDFVEKPFRDQMLLDDIQEALELNTQTRRMQDQKATIETKTALLTPREEEIMSLLVNGLSSKTIGFELGISQKTVDFHRAHILEKMGVDSVVELVILTQELQPA